MSDRSDDAAYRWDAGDYEHHSSAQKAWAAELRDALHLRGDEALLDIGSGDGGATVELAALLPRGRVVGFDSSPEMIALARERHADAGNVTFVLGDARELPFSEGFDVVFSAATLHWVTDHRPVLHGIRRALRPGGRALLQMGGRGNAEDVIAIGEELRHTPRWRAYFEGFEFPYGFFGAEEYRGWLEEAGLTPVRVELVAKDMTQDGREGLAGWVRTTWLPYTQRVPEEQREAFVHEVVDEYVRRHPIDDAGLVHVAMVRLEVEAELPFGA